MWCINALTLALLAGSAASNPDVAEKNLATTKRLCKIQQTTWKIPPAEVTSGEFIDPVKDFYAPYVNCNVVGTSKNFGYSLQNVPFGACMEADAKEYGNLLQVFLDMKCGTVAVDETGESVMLEQLLTFKLHTGKVVNLPIITKYDFNRDGKIRTYQVQYDTSIFFGETAAERNSQTIKRECEADEAMAGQTVSEAVVDKYVRDVKDVFASEIDCDQVETNKDYGFSLKGVSLEACNREVAKKYSGMHIISFKCDAIAADNSGKVVMLSQKTTLKLTTGQELSLPVLTKYTFNTDGKVVAYSSQFDASILPSISLGLAAAVPVQVPFFASLFFFGLIVFTFLVHQVMKRRIPSLAQDGYHQCA